MADSPIVARPTRSRANTAWWILQVLLAVAFVVPVYRKFAGEPASVELFSRIGFGQWLRYAVGLLELILAVGLLVPRLAGVAALGVVVVMAGATCSELFIYGGKWPLPLALLLIAATVAWGRRDRTRGLLPARSW